ncbi:hypothetical protein RIF29_28899 [Crotalaria pallida]|uniref:Uncharacterized protein n=1 Tax=Crotalaria pallida TaxID=3830 RepID=A0AAN9HTD8_CROPI
MDCPARPNIMNQVKLTISKSRARPDRKVRLHFASTLLQFRLTLSFALRLALLLTQICLALSEQNIYLVFLI